MMRKSNPAPDQGCPKEHKLPVRAVYPNLPMNHHELPNISQYPVANSGLVIQVQTIKKINSKSDAAACKGKEEKDHFVNDNGLKALAVQTETFQTFHLIF